MLSYACFSGRTEIDSSILPNGTDIIGKSLEATRRVRVGCGARHGATALTNVTSLKAVGQSMFTDQQQVASDGARASTDRLRGTRVTVLQLTRSIRATYVFSELSRWRIPLLRDVCEGLSAAARRSVRIRRN